MNRLCVLFAGTMGSGKDTAADMLAAELEALGVSTLRMAFADPIKEVVVHLLGIPKSISYGSQEDKATNQVYGKSVRHWLQWVGTELGRTQIHSDIWVHRFAQRAVLSSAQVVIGSDCRFLNEIEGMRKLMAADNIDTMIIRIMNPRVPVNLEHKSESEIHGLADDIFDMVLHNDKGLEDLQADVARLAKGAAARVT